MQPPKMRMTVGGIMIAVALVAVWLWLTDEWATRAKVAGYRRQAARYREMEIELRKMLSKAKASEIRNLGSDKGIQWMISDAERKKRFWEYAAEHPRKPLRLDKILPERPGPAVNR